MNFKQELNVAIGQVLADKIKQEEDGIAHLARQQKELVAEAANSRLGICILEDSAYGLAKRYTMPTREKLTDALQNASSDYSACQKKIEEAKAAIAQLRKIEQAYKKEGKLPDSFYKK